MKPIAGLIPLWDENKDSMWMLPGYMDGLRETGVIPVMFPLTDDREEIERLVDSVDGIVLTGGHDVDPAYYGEEPHPELGPLCQMRDAMEKIVLELALAKNKSILGICRGIQYLNVHLGGNLYQDLPTQFPSEVNHHQTEPYDAAIHQVYLEEDSPLKIALEKDEIGVNSLHHQAVKELAPSLKVMGRAADGIVEAVYLPESRFCWAVQWHPEFSYKTNEDSRKIFKEFEKSMR